jgi:hypothetical protein
MVSSTGTTRARRPTDCGNFPQVFTHLALTSCAFNLGRAVG